MDDSALQRLLARLDAGLAATGLPPGTALVPTGYTVEDIDRFNPNPNRLRGTFRTQQISDFAAYLKQEHADEDSRIFVDHERFAAIAIVNHGTVGAPQWGDHRAELQLDPTPEWTALLRLIDTGPHSQQSMLDWILDWAPCIKFSAAAFDKEWADMAVPRAIQRLRTFKTKSERNSEHDEQDLARSRSIAERAGIISDPPMTMRWTGRPYADLAERTITLRLAYDVADPPKVRVRPIGLDALKTAAAKEFADKLAGAHDTAAPLYIGSFRRS